MLHSIRVLWALHGAAERDGQLPRVRGRGRDAAGGGAARPRAAAGARRRRRRRARAAHHGARARAGRPGEHFQTAGDIGLLLIGSMKLNFNL